MRFRLRTLLIVLAAFGGCGGPASSEVGQALEGRLQNVTHVAIAHSELDGESNVAYEIDDPKEIQKLIPLLASRRSWKEIGAVGWSARQIADVEFLDSEGGAVWYCTLVGDSITFTDSDGRTWLGSWPGGLKRVMSMAKRSEPPTDNRP
jgi:hypothetical protein